MTFELLASQRWMGLWRGANDEPYIAAPDDGYMSGVVMLPIDHDNNILFVHEPCVFDSHQSVLSLPAGAIDPGEDAVTAANRELQEEIGYKGMRFDLLATLNPLARHGKWQASVVLVRDLVESKIPNPDVYDLIPTITRIPFTEFRGVIQRGELRDSTIISLLYLAEDKINGT